MKIVISGAGVAGPALAHWLHRTGHEPTLIERAPHFRTGGYAIDFWGWATRSPNAWESRRPSAVPAIRCSRSARSGPTAGPGPAWASRRSGARRAAD